MKTAARVALAVVGTGIVAAGGSAVYARHEYLAPGPLGTARAVQAPRGGLDRTADALAAAGVVASPLAFRIAAAVTSRDGPVHAAEFEFPAGASLQTVLGILRTAKPLQHRLSLPEGLSAAQMATLIANADALDGDPAVPEEGMMLPDTYLYERGVTRAALVERGRRMMERALDRAWRERRPGLPLTSPQEALVLASIVERETAKPEERPHIAAVFLNRLRLGMKLQSDPTVIYAASGGLGVLDHGITRAELDRDDPYNTYRTQGLPPGPICMPGMAALRAVTQPDDTDDLFFVADGAGGHVFSRTAEEHNRHVAHWREVERARRNP